MIVYVMLSMCLLNDFFDGILIFFYPMQESVSSIEVHMMKNLSNSFFKWKEYLIFQKILKKSQMLTMMWSKKV
jgi:hypothetical protein